MVESELTKRELFTLFVPDDCPLAESNRLSAERWKEIERRGLHGNLIIMPESMKPKSRKKKNLYYSTEM